MREIASAISVAIGVTRMLGAARTRCGRLDRVGDHQFLIFEAGDARDRPARKHAVGDVGDHRGGALVGQRLGGVAQRAAGIDDVVEEDAVGGR